MERSDCKGCEHYNYIVDHCDAYGESRESIMFCENRDENENWWDEGEEDEKN